MFGEDNLLGTFIVKSTPNARDYGHIGKMHEFILFYGKIRETFTNMLPDIDKAFKYNDDIGGFNIHHCIIATLRSITKTVLTYSIHSMLILRKGDDGFS